jgi:4-alpha-glucanotransferase
MIGIATPLSFLRSKNSQGIGDLEDLKQLIDWASRSNIDLIQILPISDTATESSPYSALSSIALHPIYLRLPQTTPFLDYLNQQDRVSYSSVYHEKMRLLALVDLKPVDPDFLEKFPSLMEYAVYKSLKEKFHFHSHETFPYQGLDPESILEKNDETFSKRVDFHLRLQQHLFQKWKEIKLYAQEKKIQLMGDLPILVSRESHEVFFHPHLFDLDYEAGAPPDTFAPEGQNWGHPIYNWATHEEEDYAFFLKRRDLLAEFFDYYRIDHVIGFFRFWKIPRNEKGTKGKFSIKDPKEYLPKAKKRLRALLDESLDPSKPVKIQPIAEDLGTKPVGMEKLLEELHIPGMRVLRWEEDTDNYPVNSLSTISLHDTSLLASWFRQETGRSINEEERFTLLKVSLDVPSKFKVNLLQEYLALIPEFRFIYDEMEQINIPATVLPINWTIRMRPFLEEIDVNTDLATKIESLLESDL